MELGTSSWGPRREDGGVSAVAVASRPSPSFRAISGAHFPPEGDGRGPGTPGTELFHVGPGSPLISSCGPAPRAGIRNIPKSDSLLLLAKLYLIQWVFPCTVDFPNVINFNIK